tara:strand:+ start:10075 stop:10617 length:543 start_codon:yes stop_codon:yes gene_type:complete
LFVTFKIVIYGKLLIKLQYLLLKKPLLLPIIEVLFFLRVIIMNRSSLRGISSYQDVNVSTKIAYANSLELTEMLFSGLSEALATAEGHFAREETSARGVAISRCLKILGGLQSSLCFDKGKDLAKNLSDIYDYCSRQLLKANINCDIHAVREVKGLIDELNSAWELLPELMKNDPVAKAS